VRVHRQSVSRWPEQMKDAGVPALEASLTRSQGHCVSRLAAANDEGLPLPHHRKDHDEPGHLPVLEAHSWSSWMRSALRYASRSFLPFKQKLLGTALPQVWHFTKWRTNLIRVLSYSFMILFITLTKPMKFDTPVQSIPRGSEYFALLRSLIG
jgi:hypothetical protein